MSRVRLPQLQAPDRRPLRSMRRSHGEAVGLFLGKASKVCLVAFAAGTTVALNLLFLLSKITGAEPGFAIVLALWISLSILALAAVALVLSLLSGLVAWAAYSQRLPWLPLIAALLATLVLAFRANAVFGGP